MKQARDPEAVGLHVSRLNIGYSPLAVGVHAYLMHPCSPCRIHAYQRLLGPGRFGGAGKTSHEMFLCTLVCNVEAGCQLLECFDDSIGWDAGLSHKFPALRPSIRQAGSAHASASPRTGPSPFPELERFVCRMCHQVPNMYMAFLASFMRTLASTRLSHSTMA